VLESKEASVILQAVPRPHPDNPKAPLAIDQIKSKEGRELFKLVVHDIGGTINRLYALPPGTPKDRVKILQRAFQDTLKDPEFLAEAQKVRLDIDPLSGDDIEKTVAGIKNIPAANLTKLRDILLPK
jgi:hypothetical protein